MTGPVRPLSRQACSVWVSRSRDGTRMSTRSASSSSALRATTQVLPDPVAVMTWVRKPRAGILAPGGSSRSRRTASTASR